VQGKEEHYIMLSFIICTPYSLLLEKLTVSQLDKNFFAFYGTQRFITAFTTARQCPYQLNPVHILPPSYYLKTHFNIILSSTQFVRLTKICLGNHMKNNEIRRACSMYGREGRCIQGFGRETLGKETIWG
jgi:hypothetical protein